MKIVYVYADTPEEWNCSEWRCSVPERAINRTHRHTAQLLNLNDFAHNSPNAQEACASVDVIVVQRNLFGPVLAAIQHWKARDKVLIADFDDAYQLIPRSNANYSFWNEGLALQPGQATRKIDPAPIAQFKWGLRLVHAATVPSRRLADDWRGYTDVHYLPNYIELQKYQNVSPERHNGVILGWGGSISHLQSFTDSGILAALKRVCSARSQVKLMVCGNDQRILDRLSLPEDRVIHQPWVPYDQWPSILTKFDIGLAPLSGKYDERRSWIKVLEYMVMKIPWIASDSPAYHDLRPYGWLVKNTPAAWERLLLDMIDHLADYRAEAAQEPYLFGISQNIDENVEKMLSTYAAISTKVHRDITFERRAEPI